MAHKRKHKEIDSANGHSTGRTPVKLTWKSLLVIGLAIIVLIAVFASVNSKEGEGLEEFAQCISDAGAVMYGASWCSHCKAQKRAFGDAFQFVNYVECPENTQTCTDAGIKGYPTWIIDGQYFTGQQPLELLGQFTGCALPE